MGSWGTAVYANDTSSDVRDMCNEVYPLVGIEKGTQLILEEYAEIVNSDSADNDCADFWFALADWQWKHGILTDEVKAKAVALLDAHTGIEEWEESGTAADVKKRLAVMDKLLTQLTAPQPAVNLPKPKIAKPRHKPGDIIIVHTCTKDHEDAGSVWNIEHCAPAYIYRPETADRLTDVLCPPYEAYDKFIAILCVDTKKTPCSPYVDGFFDGHSVYAFYDYVGDERPTVDQLRQCGFLPECVIYGEEQGGGIKTVGWRYTFTLFAYSFRLSKNSCERSLEKVSCPSERDRFFDLLHQKSDATDPVFHFELYDAFGDFFEEKARLTGAGIPYDNLLDRDVSNPPLLSPKEIQKRIQQEIETEMKAAKDDR